MPAVTMKYIRSHARAPGMKQTSVALPATLIQQLDELADRDGRSRNNLIALLLKESVTRYECAKINGRKSDQSPK